MESSQRVRAMLSFVQAADRGSFAAAARNLGISAAAVGKNVASLEAALGVRLMNRTTRSLQLTGEGLAFVERARTAIDALDAAIDAVAAQRAEPAGRVRISTSNAFGHRYVMPLLPGLQARYPALAVELDFDDRRVDLVQDGYDLALRGGVIEDSSLVSRHICQLVTVLVASPAYLHAHGKPKRLDELAAHRLISVRFLNGRVSPWSFTRSDGSIQEFLPAAPALTVSAPEASVEAALLGMGIAQVGVHHAWQELQAGRLKVLLPQHHHAGTRSLALQYPHRALVAPRVRVTVDFLLEALTRNEALQVKPEALAAFAA
jgi:DNA-binding transcriptional LysR family regulator